jgi:hypothetical protein
MPANRDDKTDWLALLVRAMVDGGRSVESHRVYVGNRPFLVNGIDLANGRLVRRIVAERQAALAAGKAPPHLVTFRREFRQIASRQRIAGLIECLEESDPEVVRLTIWLMARAHTSLAITAIAPFRYSKNDRVRYEAARGLRRLGAWAELRKIAQYDFNDRVRRLATAPSPKEFDKRLQRFAGQVHAVMPPDAAQRPMPLIVRLSAGSVRRAKTPEFIRAILERIQQLVRGH